MLDFVRLLETFACDSRPTAAADFDTALAGLEPITRAALTERNPVALARALGHPVAFACMVAVPGEDETAPNTEPNPGEPEPDSPSEPDQAPKAPSRTAPDA